jgi:hypothetical protein
VTTHPDPMNEAALPAPHEASSLADIATMVLDAAGRDHGRLTPSAILMLGELRTRAAAVARQLAAVRDLHREWGETDVDELNQLELWERLGRILAGGAL